MIWYAIIITIVILAVKLVYDYNLWLKHKQVNHKLEWLLMAVASIPAIIIFTIESGIPHYLSAPLSSVMIAGFIWFFFDGLYNKIRGYGWWFTGSEDGKDDAKSDNFLQNFDLPIQIVIKIIALIAPIVIYSITYK